MTYRSEHDKLWVELFKLALSGASVDAESSAITVVRVAVEIADAALVKVKEHMQPAGEIPPLFAPLQEKRKAQREQDEADSGFAVTR